MIEFDYSPRGVCSTNIHVQIDDAGERIEDVAFTGGCNGNLKAISKLVAGQSVEHICDVLEGNTCGRRDTSCADQLSRALREAAARAQSSPARAGA